MKLNYPAFERWHIVMLMSFGARVCAVETGQCSCSIKFPSIHQADKIVSVAQLFIATNK